MNVGDMSVCVWGGGGGKGLVERENDDYLVPKKPVSGFTRSGTGAKEFLGKTPAINARAVPLHALTHTATFSTPFSKASALLTHPTDVVYDQRSTERKSKTKIREKARGGEREGESDGK